MSPSRRAGRPLMSTSKEPRMANPGTLVCAAQHGLGPCAHFGTIDLSLTRAAPGTGSSSVQLDRGASDLDLRAAFDGGAARAVDVCLLALGIDGLARLDRRVLVGLRLDH